MKALNLGLTTLGVLIGLMAAQAQARDTAAAPVPPVQQIAPAPQAQIMPNETLPAHAQAPRYVWKGGYVHGKWREGWVPVK